MEIILPNGLLRQAMDPSLKKALNSEWSVDILLFHDKLDGQVTNNMDTCFFFFGLRLSSWLQLLPV